MRTLGRQDLAILTDVRDRQQVETIVQKAIAYFGQIDVLVNNAAVYYMGPVEEASLDDWQQVIQTNLWATFTPFTPCYRTFWNAEAARLSMLVQLVG